ncbi:MAG: hypothetical protein ACU0GG_06890 [Paracoccaceae bacterium]
MTEKSLFSKLPGANAVIEWFGREPKFHDAKISNIRLTQGQTSTITLHAWNMTNDRDAKGHYLTDKHATVGITFESVDIIELSDFDFGHSGIVFSLEISGSLEATEVRWTSSIGVEGRIIGRGVSLTVAPHQIADT